jgi:hypothetical protein
VRNEPGSQTTDPSDRHAPATDQRPSQGYTASETIERIRWRLWHGQVRALDLIGETPATLEDRLGVLSSATAVARKVAPLLVELETYVSEQSDIIIDYAKARRCEEPISTAITESTVQ